jgi:hypothetical protein
MWKTFEIVEIRQQCEKKNSTNKFGILKIRFYIRCGYSYKIHYRCQQNFSELYFKREGDYGLLGE